PLNPLLLLRYLHRLILSRVHHGLCSYSLLLQEYPTIHVHTQDKHKNVHPHMYKTNYILDNSVIVPSISPPYHHVLTSTTLYHEQNNKRMFQINYTYSLNNLQKSV